jgi:seryl-tRNA synthetase
MIDIKYIREHAEEVKENCKNRNVKCDVDKLLDLDKKRGELTTKVNELRQKKNSFKGKPSAAELKELTKVKENEEKLSKDLDKISAEYMDLLFAIPNLTSKETPLGKDDTENVEIRRFGEPKKFDFKVKDHVELGKELGILDFDAGAKVTGNKFYFLMKEGVLLEQALVNYALGIIQKHGFQLVITPDLAKTEIVNNMGYQPRGPEAQIYNIENNDLSLIGTAEITLGGLHADQILPTSELPILYGGLSHCFRTEAGAYGRHSKGLYRVHQFTKVEMFAFTTPEESEKWHEKIVQIEEELFRGLEIPIRTVEICTGDLGAVAYRKNDLEAWMPGRDDWGEVTSASNCTDYQSRNLNIKYRDDNGNTNFVHTLNGTGIAISRALIAILENFQQKDGSIIVPKVLRQYVGKDVIGKE